MRQRITRATGTLLMVWGLVALVAALWGIWDAIRVWPYSSASSTPTTTPSVAQARPTPSPGGSQVPDAWGQAAGSPGGLPTLPPGWKWFSIKPNSPVSAPPPWLLGLPVGPSAYGEATWVNVDIPRDDASGITGGAFKRGLRCSDPRSRLVPTGETLTIAGSEGTVYLAPYLRRGTPGAICIQFSYGSDPWIFVSNFYGVWSAPYAEQLAAYVVPNP